MKLIAQPADSDGCGIACVATARGLEYEAARVVFRGLGIAREYAGGFNARRLLAALGKLGARYRRVSPQSSRVGTILLVNGYGPARVRHWLVRTERGWWDPYARRLLVKLRWHRVRAIGRR